MKTWTRFFTVLLVFVLANSCSTRDEILNDEPENGMLKSAGMGKAAGNRFIVVFRDDVTDPESMAETMKGKFKFSKGHVYKHCLKGFSAEIPEEILEGMRKNPNIAYIEPDLIMTTCAQTIPAGIMRIRVPSNPVAGINGDGGDLDVDVAIIDTGVDADHPDLNVSGGVRYYYGYFTDSKYDDDNGHGTHVAGIVGAKDNGYGVVGVAPGARIWAVKVLNSSGSGYLSDIIKGIDWVTARAGTIEVANMSLGGTGTSTSYRTAIRNCVKAGVVMVVAAGNSSIDVYGSDGKIGTSDDYIPASFPEAMTISALADSDGTPGGSGSSTSYGPDDSFASFSNFSRSVKSGNPVSSAGLAIDLILPGVSIYSTYKSGQYATMSGTSMASPHGAGLAALYIAGHERASDSTEVYAIRQALINLGKAQTDAQWGLNTQNDPDGNKENIGWADFGGTPVDQPPVANAGNDQTVRDAEEDGETITLNGSASTDDQGIESYSWTKNGVEVSNNAIYSTTLTAGTYIFTLKVTDTAGQTDTDDVTVTISNNLPPVAGFNYSASGLAVIFTDTSTDPDGTIATRSWNFGDGGTSSAQNPSHSYAAAGTFAVSLTVTDNNGAPSSITKNVTVTNVQNIVLTYKGTRYRNYYRVVLSWTGGTAPYKVLRNGSQIATNINTKTYTNNLTKKGTYTYQVCKTDGTLCSNIVTVTYQ